MPLVIAIAKSSACLRFYRTEKSHVIEPANVIIKYALMTLRSTLPDPLLDLKKHHFFYLAA